MLTAKNVFVQSESIFLNKKALWCAAMHYICQVLYSEVQSISNQKKIMKKLLNLMLIALVMGFTSCKKENEADLSTVEGMKKAITSGYWQLASYQSSDSKQIQAAETYMAFSFKADDKVESYYAKGVLQSADGKYRIKMHDGRMVIVFYENADQYNKDQHSDNETYEITMQGGELKLYNTKYKSTNTLKKYSSMAATKDLPSAT